VNQVNDSNNLTYEQDIDELEEPMKKTKSLAHGPKLTNMSIDSQKGNILARLLESSQDYTPAEKSEVIEKYSLMKSEVQRNTALYRMNTKRMLTEQVLKHYIFNPTLKHAENLDAPPTAFCRANFYLYGHLLLSDKDVLVHSMLTGDGQKLK
jgi:hypothetical protein